VARRTIKIAWETRGDGAECFVDEIANNVCIATYGPMHKRETSWTRERRMAEIEAAIMHPILVQRAEAWRLSRSVNCEGRPRVASEDHEARKARGATT
jgi:hypothetical protein